MCKISLHTSTLYTRKQQLTNWFQSNQISIVFQPIPSWWIQPIRKILEKIIRKILEKIESFPQFSGWKIKIFETTKLFIIFQPLLTIICKHHQPRHPITAHPPHHACSEASVDPGVLWPMHSPFDLRVPEGRSGSVGGPLRQQLTARKAPENRPKKRPV